MTAKAADCDAYSDKFLELGDKAPLASTMRRMEDSLKEDMQHMEDRIENRLANIESRLSVLEHSQAKLEGLLEGLREAIVSRAAA